MTLPSSGPLALTDIQTEFGGSNPIGLNEYYAGGGLVPAGTSGTYGAVPSSGALSVQNFYGTSNYIPVYIEDLFSTYVYTGTGATRTITNGINISGSGGLVWTKSRSNPYSHLWYDTNRGVGNYLISNSSAASQYNIDSLSAFLSTGFTLGPSDGSNSTDGTAQGVSWTFRKQPKFFDIVTWTGLGTSVPHNLGVVPGFVIFKRTDTSESWYCAHQSVGGFGVFSSTLQWLNSTLPNPEIISVSTSTTMNFSGFTVSGGTYVAYLFASNAGGFGLTGSDNIITCGRYDAISSGSPVVTLGYEPQWIMIKSIGNQGDYGNWGIWDSMRGLTVGSNGSAGFDPLLDANRATQEGTTYTDTGDYITPTATGFIVDPNRSGWSINNSGSGNSYVYIAIRRGPMKVPTVGTTVFNPVVRTADGNYNSTAPSSLAAADSVLTKWRDPFSNYVAWPWGARLTGTNRDLYTYSTLNEAAENVWGYHNGFDMQYGVKLQSGAYGQQLVNYSSSSLNYVDYFFARAPGFYDVVCYSGTGTSNLTVNHNLTVAPEMAIVKMRSNSGDWNVYTSALPAVNQLAVYLNDNNNGPSGSGGAALWNFTSTTFNVNNTTLNLNNSSQTYIAHLFATCPGVSKVGSYTGTGALQTINCGFTTGARFVLIRRVDSGADWYVWDSARGISSGSDPYLLVNSRQAEVTGTNYVDTTSVGFQVTAAAPSAINANGGTFIFLAIA